MRYYLTYILLIFVSIAFLNTFDGYADTAKPKKTKTKVKVVQIFKAKKKGADSEEDEEIETVIV